MPTSTNMENLVINRVPSTALYNKMKAKNLINEDELYLVEGGSTQSETISIATTDWSGSGPYTATKTLTNTYDSTNHDVIISLPKMSSSDVEKYDAIASAKMVISACSGTSVTIIALGDKPTVPVSIAIMQV